MTSRFKEALDFLDREKSHEGVLFMIRHYKEAKLALRIADRLERGNVSDGMVQVMLEEDYEHESMTEVFKAMTNQLIKEEEEK